MSAGSEVAPSEVVRNTSFRRVRPSSRSSFTVSESVSRSMRSAASRSSSSAIGRCSSTSSAVTVSRTESGPVPIRLPNTRRPARVRWPSAMADGRSARPLHRRITVVGGTVRSGPAPSRLRDRRSTRPSRQSESLGSGTSNGATAIKLASSGGASPPCRAMRNPARTTPSPMPTVQWRLGAGPRARRYRRRYHPRRDARLSQGTERLEHMIQLLPAF